MTEDIVITGASSGIGEALSRELVTQGYRVWGIARDETRLHSLQNELGSKKFFYTIGDVVDPKTFSTAKKEMVHAGFSSSIFVLGAAIFETDIALNFNLEQFTHVIDINVVGVATTIDAFLPTALEKKSGHFILLSSIAAFRPNQRGIAYSASKAAASLVFRGFNLHYKRNGLVFTTLYLGPVATKMWEGKKSWLVLEPATMAKRISRHISSRRTSIYLPFLSTTLARISMLLSDSIYAKLSQLFK